MGRRRRKGGNYRKHNSETAKVTAKISAANLEKRFKDTLKYQEDKTAQTEYLSSVAEIEEEILSRSIFVSNVKDLKKEGNLAELRRFFEVQYGRVEECVLAQQNGRKKRGPRNNFPPARVRFVRKQDAEKVFGGEALLTARGNPSVELTGCRVAHGNAIRVRPSDPYPNMTEHVLSGTSLKFPASTLALGHWFSAGEEDSYNIVRTEDETKEDTSTNLWLEEKSCTSTPSVKIDIRERTVEIELENERSEMDRLFAMLSTSMTCVISFQFKDLLGPIEFFPAESALFFRLKYPPKLYRSTKQDLSILGIFYDQWSRQVALPGLPTSCLGGCLGYKLTLDKTAFSIVQANQEAVEKIRRFGIWEDNPATVQTQYMTKAPLERAAKKMKLIHDFKAGLLLRTLVDNGHFCWYHTLYDQVNETRDLFDLINSTPTHICHLVLRRMDELHGQTRYPISVFIRLAFLEGDEAEEDVSAVIPSHCVELPRVLLTPTRVAVVGFQVEVSNRITRKYINDEGYDTDRFLRLSIGDENGDKLFSDQLSPPVEKSIFEQIRSGITISGRTYYFLAYSSSQLKELSLWMVAPPFNDSVARIRNWMGDFSNCKTPSKYAARMGQCFSTTVQTLASRSERALGETRIAVNDKLEDIITKLVGNKEMCHSDGTGIIKKELMAELLKRLPFAPTDLSTVSVIQIRIGGAKGTLTAWNLNQLSAVRKRTFARGGNINLSYDVHLRPSMVKFQAEYRRLEVVSIGAHIPYYLNRNVILLLGVHGVEASIFQKMQRSMLDTLDKMLYDATTAAEIIPRLSGPDSTLSAAIVHMIHTGLAPDKEPFLFSALHAIRTHHLTNLRKKSRIFVRDGAVLIGGLDETGLIDEGCVFVQVSRGNDGKFAPLVGPVMVTKHPVMHPGDVRMLQAVDKPELREHKNVILFSQWGNRPEANKMAGSDLDGDQFAVTWDPRLFLNEWNCCTLDRNGVWTWRKGRSTNGWKNDIRCLQEANADAMDYTAPPAPPVETDGAITDKEIIQHFINHAKNDNLGRIANMWLDYAAKFGANCSQCIQLAQLHSIAVDFPKSGVPAIVPGELSLKDAPRAHWRERKDDVPTYHCKGVLGKLYDEVVARRDADVIADQTALAGRVVDKHGQILCFVQDYQRYRVRSFLQDIFQPHIAAKLGWNLDTVGPDEDEMLLLSNNQRREYDGQLMSLMSKYHLHSEGELLTGCIRKYHRLNKRRQHDLSEEVKGQCRELRRMHRRAFFEEVLSWSYPGDVLDNLSEEEYDELVMVTEQLALDRKMSEGTEKFGFLQQDVRKYSRLLAGAMYMVTYHPKMRLRDHADTLLFSFPWIVADVISHGVNATSM